MEKSKQIEQSHTDLTESLMSTERFVKRYLTNSNPNANNQSFQSSHRKSSVKKPAEQLPKQEGKAHKFNIATSALNALIAKKRKEKEKNTSIKCISMEPLSSL